MPETVSSEPNKTMGYRAGEEKDLEGIMAVIHDAQRTMGEAGLDQWQDGYPSEEIIRDDIRNGESRVWEEDGTILGTAMLSFRGEPNYDRISSSIAPRSFPAIPCLRIVDSTAIRWIVA